MNRANRYAVEYDPRAVKELSKLDKTVARRIFTAIDALAAEPRPAGCRALTGYPGLWRIRVGDYRVVYPIKDAELIVLALRVAHRRQCPSTAVTRHSSGDAVGPVRIRGWSSHTGWPG